MGDLNSPGATVPRCAKRDPITEEWVLDQSGRRIWLTGAAAIGQAIRHAFNELLGEWFLDTTKGTDWRTFLKSKFSESGTIQFVTNRLLSVTGVSEVEDVTVNYDSADRAVSVSAAVETDYGPLPGGVILPIPNAQAGQT